jgi:hypothetical protein
VQPLAGDWLRECAVGGVEVEVRRVDEDDGTLTIDVFGALYGWRELGIGNLLCVSARNCADNQTQHQP